MADVNWRKTNTYQFIKQSERNSGMSYAEQNFARGLSCHSIWGVLGVNLFQGVTSLALNKFGESSNTGSATDVQGNTNTLSGLGKTLAKFDKAISSNNKNDADKHLKSLEQLHKDNPDNNRIRKAYENAKTKRGRLT